MAYTTTVSRNKFNTIHFTVKNMLQIYYPYGEVMLNPLLKKVEVNLERKKPR